VIALLAFYLDKLIPDIAKGLIRELFFDAFDFLQTQHVRLLLCEELHDLINP